MTSDTVLETLGRALVLETPGQVFDSGRSGFGNSIEFLIPGLVLEIGRGFGFCSWFLKFELVFDFRSSF